MKILWKKKQVLLWNLSDYPGAECVVSSLSFYHFLQYLHLLC